MTSLSVFVFKYKHNNINLFGSIVYLNKLLTSLNLSRYKLILNGVLEISLKEKELMLFKLLCSKTNHAFTTENIFYHLYGNNEKDFSEYSVTSFIKRLRAKLPENLIENEYGLGYKIVLK